MVLNRVRDSKSVSQSPKLITTNYVQNALEGSSLYLSVLLCGGGVCRAFDWCERRLTTSPTPFVAVSAAASAAWSLQQGTCDLWRLPLGSVLGCTCVLKTNARGGCFGASALTERCEMTSAF